MNLNDPKLVPTWALRVRQSLVRRLYENDAIGIQDVELMDEVGWGLYFRCQSFVAANEAVKGRVECPSCGKIIHHHCQPAEVLSCDGCQWSMAWKDYFKTIQHKQLSGAAPVINIFQDYTERFPQASDNSEKMLLIDTLIHTFHWNVLTNMNTRAAGVNLIEGNLHEVVDFLDRLSYGPGSTPGLVQERDTWRGQIDQIAVFFITKRPQTME